MYVLPQEIEVWYIIPAIRKELSKELVKTHKLSYEKTGNLLGISKAAVSQYLSNKRANKITLSKEVKQEVKKSAEIIIKDNKKSIHEIQRILNLMKQKGCCCEICKKYNPDIIEYCKEKPTH